LPKNPPPMFLPCPAVLLSLQPIFLFKTHPPLDEGYVLTHDPVQKVFRSLPLSPPRVVTTPVSPILELQALGFGEPDSSYLRFHTSMVYNPDVTSSMFWARITRIPRPPHIPPSLASPFSGLSILRPIAPYSPSVPGVSVWRRCYLPIAGMPVRFLPASSRFPTTNPSFNDVALFPLSRSPGSSQPLLCVPPPFLLTARAARTLPGARSPRPLFPAFTPGPIQAKASVSSAPSLPFCLSSTFLPLRRPDPPYSGFFRAGPHITNISSQLFKYILFSPLPSLEGREPSPFFSTECFLTAFATPSSSPSSSRFL